MNDDFKEKLERYEKGEMTEAEKEAFEMELEQKEKSMVEPSLTKEKQRKILRTGKWKARIGTALTVLPLLLLIMMGSSFLTNLYYYGLSTGLSEEYNRAQRLNDIVIYSSLITDPYAESYPADTEVGTFFNMDLTRDLKKIVGKESYVIGQMNVNFLFSKMGIANNSYYGKGDNPPEFYHPSLLTEYKATSDDEWERLDKLPEGTVTTAFISFNKLMNTEEIFSEFQNKDLDLLWFPVHTPQAENIDFPVSHIGFPNYPIFLHDDWQLESRTEERSLFGATISETRSTPSYEVGDTEMLHSQFYKALEFLKDHQKEFQNLPPYYNVELDEFYDYVNKNSITHYGVVLTGPTKEVLSLKEEDWLGSIRIDEVALWNWHSE